MIALAAIALGLALGAASGGSVGRLEAVRLRFEVPVLLLFVVQGVARGRITGTSATSFGLLVWVASCVGLLILLVPDWRRAGVWAVAVGMGLNLFVVLINGGMPVALPNHVVVGSAAASVAQSMGFYQLAGPGTVLAAAGDVVALSFGSYRLLLSPGDILLAVGVAVLIVDAMQAPSRATASRSWDQAWRAPE